jgi:hypothetical protein
MFQIVGSFTQPIHRSGATMFEDLYELLSRYKVDSVEKFDSISTANRRALSGRLGLYFRDNLPAILDRIEESQGLVLNFDRFNPKVNPLEKVARKALFYSDISVALLDAEIQIGLHARASRSKHKKIHRKTFASNIAPLIQTLLEIRPLVQKGILIPLPGQILIGEDALENDVQFRYNHVLSEIRGGKYRSVIIPVTLDRWAIRRQIEEIEQGNSTLTATRPVRIFLPQIRGLATDSLLGLREDNYDAFLRFQRALREFASSSQRLASETMFLELARKVDYEVQLLEARVKTMEADRRRHGWEVVFGMALTSLTLLVSPEVAAVLASFVAKKTLWDGVQYLRIGKGAFANDDYYMAYLVSKATPTSRNSLSGDASSGRLLRA